MDSQTINDETAYLHTREAAERAGVAPQTLRLWACYGGIISPIKKGGKLLWSIKEIDEYVALRKARNAGIEPKGPALTKKPKKAQWNEKYIAEFLRAIGE